MTEAVSIAIAIIGSGALSALVAGIFNLIVNRKGRLAAIEHTLAEINEKLEVAEKDQVRTQLLLMLANYMLETQEIMKIGEHYFKDLHGDWYATSLFNKWLTENHIASPEWFDPTE
jgi:hypothetical protein